MYMPCAIFNLPGMKIFQFAFANTPADPFLPHNYPHNCVAYTGTHDNDTARGWYESHQNKSVISSAVMLDDLVKMFPGI
jgi:4-alpha-glucanotransferase